MVTKLYKSIGLYQSIFDGGNFGKWPLTSSHCSGRLFIWLLGVYRGPKTGEIVTHAVLKLSCGLLVGVSGIYLPTLG